MIDIRCVRHRNVARNMHAAPAMRLQSAILVAALLVPSAASAQQPESSEKPPTTILTGCLRSSGADTAIAGPSGRLYTLEVVEAPPRPAATPTTGATAPRASKTTYSLAAEESVGLAKHVDHEVQLTGRLQAPSSPPSPPGAAKTSESKPGGAHNTFNVTAVKMISIKCAS